MKKALHLEFLDEVLIAKYDELIQKVADKSKGIVEEEEATTIANIAKEEEISEHDLEEATRRSLLENYPAEGESSENPNRSN